MLAPGTTIDAFVVVRPLGRGGASTVYSVRHRTLGTEHALKVVHQPGHWKRLRAEGDVQSRIISPNVVPVQAVLDLEGEPALLMPQVRGCSLKELLEGHALTMDEARALFVGIVDGVAAAHAMGTVHRDLKPANVLLDLQSGHVVPRIADFGIARVDEAGDTATGAFLGTRGYAAPEQREDASRVTVRADLWSLGVLLHEMVTGHRPSTVGKVAERLPNDIGRLLSRLLDHHPDRRGESAVTLRRELGEPSRDCLSLDAPLGQAVHRRFALVSGATEAFSTFDEPPSVPLVPAERDAWFGRPSDLAQLRRLLDQGRLVTITGFGGVGKTRLLQQFLRNEASSVFWCDLSECRDMDAVLGAVARGLGVTAGHLDVARLTFALGERGACTVALDNVEQVLDPVTGLIDAWFTGAPKARMMVTSRVPLQCPGERCFSLDPLDSDAAAALFVDRARAVDARFDGDRTEPIALNEVVLALDGVPLALELAAARVGVLSLPAMHDRLEDRFRLLAAPKGRPDRQGTLRATLDWSWELLETEEQSALSQLGAFEGSFSLETAEAVLDVSAWPLDLLAALVRHSLVQVAEDNRFRLLHSVRAYAAGQLSASGQRASVGARFGETYAAFAADWHRGMVRHDWDAMRTLERESDNLLAACRYALDADDVRAATGCLRAAWALFEQRGRATESIAHSERILDHPHLDAWSAAYAGSVLGGALRYAGRPEEAEAAYRRAIDAATEGELATARATVTMQLALLLADRGRYDEVEQSIERARSTTTPSDLPQLYPAADLGLGMVAQLRGHAAQAERHYLAVLERGPVNGDRFVEARVRNFLGSLFTTTGRYEDARRELTSAKELFRRYHATFELVSVLNHLANLALLERRDRDAEGYLRETLDSARTLGLARVYAIALGALGVLRDNQGDLEGALALQHEVLDRTRAVGSPQHAGIALANLGRLQGLLGNLPEAYASFEDAIAELRSIGDRGTEAACRLYRATVLLREGRPETAEQDLDVALPLLAVSGNARLLAQGHACQGHLAALRDRPDDALALWEQALGALGDLGARQEQAIVLADRATHEARWNVAEARTTLQRAEAQARPLAPPSGGELSRRLIAAREALHRDDPWD